MFYTGFTVFTFFQGLMKIYEPCARVIESCNLATVVMFVEDIQQEESQSKSKPVAIAIQNKVSYL